MAPGPQLGLTMRAGQPACQQLGLDNVGVVSYDEHNGASGHPRGPLRARPKRSEGVLAFLRPPHVAARATGNATTPRVQIFVTLIAGPTPSASPTKVAFNNSQAGPAGSGSYCCRQPPWGGLGFACPYSPSNA